MHSQLVVINRAHGTHYSPSGKSQALESLTEPQWVLWKTCIRSIAMSHNLDSLEAIKKDVLPTDDVYKGQEAVRFLMEVVCGLHSPVVGETEVHGQFKDLLDKIGDSHELSKKLKDIHLKARKVRDAHLRGLGSQSYGSLARRRVRGFEKVCILGVGQLTREVLPWLAKLDIEIELFSRKPEKHQDLIERYKRVQVRHIDESKELKNAALIISAPMTSGRIADWIGNQEDHIQLILDYRGESHFDPLKPSTNYFNLKDIFKEIDNTKQKVEAEVGRAKLFISSLCN